MPASGRRSLFLSCPSRRHMRISACAPLTAVQVQASSACKRPFVQHDRSRSSISARPDQARSIGAGLEKQYLHTVLIAGDELRSKSNVQIGA